MTFTTNQQAKDAAILRELAGKTLNASSFALNTDNLPDAAKGLREALGYVERLIQALGAASIHSGDFHGYSINAALEDKPTPAPSSPTAANAFAGYSLNEHIDKVK